VSVVCVVVVDSVGVVGGEGAGCWTGVGVGVTDGISYAVVIDEVFESMKVA
jgi:hypothetical protein